MKNIDIINKGELLNLVKFSGIDNNTLLLFAMNDIVQIAEVNDNTNLENYIRENYHKIARTLLRYNIVAPNVTTILNACGIS